MNNLLDKIRSEASLVPVEAPKGRQTKRQRQDSFLKALEKHFYVSKACRASGVSRADVKDWLHSEQFMESFSEAQEAYIEGIEEYLVKIGVGVIKGNALPLMAFLNAHHPQHGRIKSEMLSRILGPMMERFYSVTKEFCTEEIADRVNKRIKEIADKKLSEFSD